MRQPRELGVAELAEDAILFDAGDLGGKDVSDLEVGEGKEIGGGDDYRFSAVEVNETCKLAKRAS